MSENHEKCLSPGTVVNPKIFSFIKQKIFTFKQLESENVDTNDKMSW